MLFTIFGFGKQNSPYFPFHNIGRSALEWLHSFLDERTIVLPDCHGMAHSLSSLN